MPDGFITVRIRRSTHAQAKALGKLDKRTVGNVIEVLVEREHIRVFEPFKLGPAYVGTYAGMLPAKPEEKQS